MSLRKSNPSTLWAGPYRKAVSQIDLGISNEAQALGQKHSGIWLALIVAYIFLDLIRPGFVWHFPKIISILLVGAWLFHPNKKWNKQVICFIALLGVMFVDVFFAANTFDAFWTSYGMLTLFVGFCIPLIHFVDSLRRLTILINTLIVIFVYIGAYSIGHAGFGPAGTDGGQDENYVGAMMAMALPFSYYSFLFEKSRLKKIFFVFSSTIYVIAIVVGMSRGAFLGLAVVLFYCIWKSPYRVKGLIAGLLLAAVVALVAGESYWGEMETITEVDQGTADMRLELWTIALREFQAYPVTGVGAGNFRWRIGEVQSQEQFLKYGRDLTASALTHSFYFELLAELGLAGTLLVAAILFHNYKDLRSIAQQTGHMIGGLKRSGGSTGSKEKDAAMDHLRWIEGSGQAMSASLLGCLVTSAFISTLYYSYFWLFTSMIIVLRRVAESEVANAKVVEK